MERSFAFVTTCSREGWNTYGARLADSFSDFFPSNVRLYFYVDFKISHPDSRIVFRQINDTCVDLLGFQQGIGRRAFARGEWIADSNHQSSHHAHVIWNARKFSFKVFTIEHAVLNSSEDAVLWIDADTFAFEKFDEAAIGSTIPSDCMISYLGRSWKYSECGYIGYNIRHPATREFVSTVAGLFRTGFVFSLKEWHDSYVFDVVRVFFEQNYGVRTHNISKAVEHMDHVFINSKLGLYLDHLKGERKEEGRSRERDLKVNHDAEYWRAPAKELAGD